MICTMLPNVWLQPIDRSEDDHPNDRAYQMANQRKASSICSVLASAPLA